MRIQKFTGLMAATHTPFTAEGALRLDAISPLAAHLSAQNVHAVFIGGTTGEFESLTLAERLALAERWFAVVKERPMRIVVHVGSNCQEDARVLAAQAEYLGAVGIAALAPSYFKPRSVGELVRWCREIAAAAPETPFYYYDIPAMTGVVLPMAEFAAQAADQIPTFAGIKYTSADLVNFQLCRQVSGGRLDLLWGMDECLLAALALGARGCVGSTYNFAAPLYHRLLAAFEAGDLEAARTEQLRSAQLVKALADLGYFGAAKALMRMLGVDVGPARQPHANPTAVQQQALRERLQRLGFFDWIGQPSANASAT